MGDKPSGLVLYGFFVSMFKGVGGGGGLRLLFWLVEFCRYYGSMFCIF